MKNRLTELLKIEYPIIQGGMMEISRARLVAAVSNAGGMGTLGQRMDLAAWRDEVKKTRDLTDKPFAINLPMHVPDLDKRLDIIKEEGVKVVATAAGNPARVIGELKDAGVTVIHVVGSAAQAVKVEAAGVEAVVAEGGESGGMVGKDRVSTIVLAPEAVDAVKIPVVAAGGLCDARGLVAALALGAQGVQLGTRFVACLECDAPQKWKDAIIKARDTDTHIVPRGKAQARMLKDEVEKGAMAGIVAARIDKIETVESIIHEMVSEAEQVLARIKEQIL